MKKLEQEIQSCVDKFEHLKVNLTSGESGDNGEGIWATPCTAKDKKIYEKGEQGDKFSVYLCNSPVSWSGVHWGSVVVVINNGGSRAYARLSDNESSHHDELTERSVKKQLFENASK